MKAAVSAACLAALAFAIPVVLAQSARPAPAPAAAPAVDNPFAREYTYMLSAGEARGAIDQGNTNMVVGYLSGVMDAQMREHDFCVPEGTNPGVVGAKVYQLLSQQPRESKAPAADVVVVYLQSDYPCRK